MEPFAVVGLASFRVTSNGYWTWKHVVIFYSTRLVTDGIDDHLKSLFRNLAFSIWLRMKDFTISFSSWPLLFSIFQAALLIFDLFRRSWWWLWWSNLYSVYRGVHLNMEFFCSLIEHFFNAIWGDLYWIFHCTFAFSLNVLC